MLAALLTTVFFSVSAVCANRTARLLGGAEASFWRILLATLILAALSHTIGAGFQGPALGLFFASGVVGFGIGDLALYQAFPRLGSRLSIMLVHCLAAPFAAVVEWLWLRTHITAAEAASSALILFGVVLALAPSDHLAIPRKTLVFGVAMGILAALGQGAGAVLSRKAFDFSRAGGFEIGGVTAAYQRIWGGLLVAVISVVCIKAFRREPRAKKDWRKVTPWLLINAATGPALGVACYQWALATAPTAIVLPIVALTPLTIIPIAWAVDGERPSRRSLLGGVVAVAGVIGLTLARHT